MQGSRGVAELRFPYQIGVDYYGRLQYTVRVVVESCGWFCSPKIWTAYPIR
jgi:hypothetical protein